MTNQYVWISVFSFIIVFLNMTAPSIHGQQFKDEPLDSLGIINVEQQIKSLLAGEDEKALRQILVQVTVSQDTARDTSVVYDLIVDYDPSRYENPRVGTYPLTFQQQFVFWGKRIANYTNNTTWTSGRLYLRDISTGTLGWIFTEEARKLYKPKIRDGNTYPSPYTELENISQWLKLVRIPIQ